MTTVEKKLIGFCEKHLDILVVSALTLLSILVRYGVRDVLSGDASLFLLPWYEEIKDGGGFKALEYQVGNYNMLYQTLIALLSYLPIAPLYAYKILSLFFDYCLAVVVGVLAYQFSVHNKKWKGIFAYIAVILSPIVILNSSAWAQCDSIYVCFALMALLMMCREKYVPAFLFLGAAFSFKLQAVFLLPFFLFAYIWRKRFSILHFLIIPVTMCVLNLAGVIMGRSFLDIFTIYLKQTGEYPDLAQNYPSVWCLLVGDHGWDYYWYLNKAGILFTVAILLILLTYFYLKKIEWNPHNLVYIAFLSSYACVLFLPAMHERYGYLYEILAIVILIWKKETVVLFVPMYCLTLLTYAYYLFNTTTKASTVAALVNIVVYLGYLFLLTREMSAKKNT
ncbi:MAG: hypothetical protein NC121_03165 [Blautia sp.]|nr:hypothetical protein [Blautia sp.]